MKKREFVLIFSLLFALIGCSQGGLVKNGDSSEGGGIKSNKSSLKEEYGDTEVLSEDIETGTISVVAPKGGRIQEIVGNAVEVFFRDEEAVFVDKKQGAPGTTGFISVDIGVSDIGIFSLEKEVESTKRFMGIVRDGVEDVGTVEVFEADTSVIPGLEGYDYYLYSIKDGIRVAALMKELGAGESYLSVSFIVPENDFSENKLNAIHEIISSIEYES